MRFNWKELQNGSDIRGVAMEGVPGEEVNLNGTIVRQLGKAFYQWCHLKFSGQINIAVGTDSRLSGPELKNAFAEGIVSRGGNVLDCGLASTPAMFMITQSKELDVKAGVMLTASHLPFNRNGLKFFTPEGGLDKADITEILKIASEKEYPDEEVPGIIIESGFIDHYSTTIVDMIRRSVNSVENYDQPLAGLKIIVDAGNGAGGFFVNKILEPLGAITSGSQFLEPDGNFPNHIPNPENNEAMESICNAVVSNRADLGIIFDTDVDRAAIVDGSGNPINRNALIALISAIILEEHPGSTIVTDSITSEGLTQFIEKELKGSHHRFKRGYRNVINEAIRLNREGTECWLAIETSGHAALKENHFLDDGAYLVAKILVKVAQLHAGSHNIGQLIEKLNHPLESKEFRFPITDPDFIKYGNHVIGEVKKKVISIDGWDAEKNNHEGIRVKCKNKNELGWFLLRLSLHDPVMPLNVESDTKGGVDAIMQKLNGLISSFSGLKAQ